MLRKAVRTACGDLGAVGEAERTVKPVRRRWQFSGGGIGLLAAILFFSLAGSVDAQIVPGSAEIKALTGRAETLAQGQTQWIAGRVGARLPEGTEIRTFAGASAELVLPDTSNILLAENSRFAIAKIVVDRQSQSRFAAFHLSVGKVQAALAQSAIQLVQARQSNFVISTPTGVAATRGTIMVTAFNPATQTTFFAVLRGSALFADNATRTPVVVGVNSFATQVGATRPTVPVPISVLPAPVQAQLGTRSNPATAGQPALVAPPAPRPSTPQVAAVMVTAQVKVAPAQAAAVTAAVAAAAPEAAAAATSVAVATAPNQAAAITAAAVAAAPAFAAAITSGAVTAAPVQAAAITSAAVVAAPVQAAAITSAAVGAAPAAAAAITQAAITAAPTQAAAISTAATTPTAPATFTAVVAPPPDVTTIAAPPPTPVPVSTVAQDIITTTTTPTQQCASPPCP